MGRLLLLVDILLVAAFLWGHYSLQLRDPRIARDYICSPREEGDSPNPSLANAWRALCVPAADLRFLDMQLIAGAVRCKQLGIDPYTTRECDPYARLYNYPPLWLELSPFSVGPKRIVIASVVVALACVVALYFIADVRRVIAASIVMLAAISPPVLFGIERGNTDLLVFAGVVGLAYAYDARSAKSIVLTSIGIVFLSAAKLYPVALSGLFLVHHRRRPFVAVATVITSAAVTVLWAGSTVPYVLSNTQLGPWRSHGAAVVALQTGLVLPGVPVEIHEAKPGGHYAPTFDVHYVSSYGGRAGLRTISACAVGLLSMLLVAQVGRSRRATKLLPENDGSTPDGRVALAGGLLSCATFFIFGSNFDYRLIFLLPCIVGALKEFEASDDRRLLLFPVAATLYLWLTPFGTVWEDLLGWMLMTAALAAVCRGLVPSFAQERVTQN